MRYQGRNALAARLAALVQMALTRRALPPVPELAERFGVTRRTVWRDVSACRAAGVPMPVRKLDRYGAEAL